VDPTLKPTRTKTRRRTPWCCAAAAKRLS